METLAEIETQLDELQVAKAAIAAREAELIRAADAMQAPFMDGARTMSEWVARKLDVEHRTATRLVRTAMADIGDVSERLASGELSVDRAHAYTDAALAGYDLTLLDGLEIAAVHQLCRRKRTPEAVDRYLAVQRSLDGDHYKLHGRLGATQGAVVTQALDAKVDELTAGVPAHERPPRSELRADALTDICENGTRSTVVSVHKPAEGGVEVNGVRASDGEADHATCVGQVETVTGTTTSRATSTIPPAQRRRVLQRDMWSCAIEGCVARTRLEIHHITHRSRGGCDHDENLVTLCWFHHHVAIHRRGMEIDRSSPPGRRRLYRPDTARDP